MGSRRPGPPSYEGRAIQSPGMTRHGPFPRSMEPLPPEFLENKLAVQVEEIEQLAADNHRLAATHVALTQDLGAAEQEIRQLREHVRSIQTETDVQIQGLLDKIAKGEADLKSGENLKKDLQQAHSEGRALVIENQDLAVKIRQATQELEKASADNKRLPEMHAELDSLREEHQRLRGAFEYEKGLNVEKVQSMQRMEKELISMANEVEKLRAEVTDVEKRVHAYDPYAHPYANFNPLYPLSSHGGGSYMDKYARQYAQTGSLLGEEMNPYGNAAAGAPSSGVGVGNLSSAGATSAWSGAFDASRARR